ncbi:cation diffusion facilitator family transporter [Sulfurovum sp. zt1-1]|uniref:Cation diffusion facilitator family transporter n=1 Tax=Sulfurovum zhangzhouensis TaxID=3019067 RepID=A0ABT7QY87_9BACT|nr:cation diffusion facilitator family transporter [Sulfurovum zhangzhouensis]MDM5271795.1 cation diffusion facilitator family transporter [Sulfurovum zhangzhouensis]
MKAKKILLIIFFNLAIILAEIIFGLISNSFALIADALHNAGDVLAIIITYIALRFGTISPTFQYTFGFIRAEMMAAFTNTLFLLLTMFYMIYESIGRLFHPEIIAPEYMIVVGMIAVVANGISAYLLHGMGIEDHHHHEHHEHHEHDDHDDHDHGDANITSAYLHMLADTLISVGVVVAGFMIYYFEIYAIDAVLTIIFSLYIIRHSFPLFKRSFLSLMDANTLNIALEELEAIIFASGHVSNYHDLHIYQPNSKLKFISFHVLLENEDTSLRSCEAITGPMKEKLEKLGFNHILIQVDSLTNDAVHQKCIITNQ